MSLIYRAGVCSDRAVSLFICTPYPGADFLLAIMETIYVVTGKTIYRDRRASGVSSSVSTLLLAWLPADDGVSVWY